MFAKTIVVQNEHILGAVWCWKLKNCNDTVGQSPSISISARTIVSVVLAFERFVKNLVVMRYGIAFE